MFVRWSRRQRKDQCTGEWRHTGEYQEMSPGIVERFPEYAGKTFPVREPIIRAEYLLTASVVESYRNAEGKPRQRTVCYLGSIREKHLDLASEYSIFHRGYFWEGVDSRLGELQLSDSDRAAIITALEDRVPRPATEDVERDRAETEARIARVSRIAGGRM